MTVQKPQKSRMSRPSKHTQLEQLLAEHGQALARLAATYEKRPSLRDELLQEFALAIWKALPAFRGECSTKTFVFRIATYRAMTHLSRRIPQAEMLEEADDLRHPDPGPEEVAMEGEESRQLMTAVMGLPLGLRQVISLALEGFNHREIGDVLGLTESNVAVRMHRGKERLKSLLGARDE
jgi:RNA polymerase sigma-70 factor (ECF subfamily)